MTGIAMPRLSDSMEQGTILSWLKQDGETVAVGDELLEIETDKATMTFESPEAGVLAITAAAGETLPVGALIAHVGDGVADEGAAGGDQPDAVHNLGEIADPPSRRSTPENGRVLATPIAARMADVHGIDLASVTGTGLRGRVTRADVAAVAGITIAAPPPPARRALAPTESPAPQAAADDATVTRDLTRLQRTVARRMAEAKATVPEFQVQTEIVMDAALALRAQLKAAAVEDTVAPSVNDLIVKASALALRAHPLANGSFRDDRFELHPSVNVGFAVAAADALVVPAIRDADRRSLGDIAAETRRLAASVRDRSITPAELSGATFTVSNLGMFGMTAITPVINVPQAAILGVGASRPVLARDDQGEIVDRQLMTLTLTCDHRILYGADAARFLAAIRELLEHPMRLTL